MHARQCLLFAAFWLLPTPIPSVKADPAAPLTNARAEPRTLALAPVVFMPGAEDSEQTKTVMGVFDPGARDWVYLPLEIPAGVHQIDVSYSYDKPAPPAGQRGNALDIGIFDESGITLGDARGFRGWSGGFRTSFVISRNEATPGYLPGPIHPGRWHIILGPYSVCSYGMHWTVDVTLRFGDAGPSFVPHYAPQRAPGRGRAWYRGDMHLHTVHSDGRRMPDELARGARAAGLDFIVSTEHNTSSAHAVWGQYAGSDLLILNGEEITTRNGHYLALGLPAGEWIDWRYRAVDDALPWFLHQIHRAGALAVAAHPYCPFVGCAWKFGYHELDAIEVWNGPWTQDDEVSLSTWDGMLVATGGKGRWVPALGNSDAHSEGQVIGLPQSVVLADAPELRSLLAGIQHGQLWIAESAAVSLSFTASAASRSVGIGERLEVDDAEQVTVDLRVTGAEGCIVRLFTDEGQVLETTLPASGSGSVSWTTTPRVSRYARAEIRRTQQNAPLPTTMVALINPIFLGR